MARVYFCTNKFDAKIFADALEAAGKRGDRVLSADQVLAGERRIVAAELRATTVLIDAAERVITFPDWRSDRRTELEVEYATAAGKEAFSASSYIDVERSEWRPIPYPADDAPNAAQPKPRPEHGSRVARIFSAANGGGAAPEPFGSGGVRYTREPGPAKGFMLLRCQKCGRVSSFYLKYPTSSNACRACGADVRIDRAELFPAYAVCPEHCGQNQIKYLTNVDPKEGGELQAKCLTCRAKIILRPTFSESAWTSPDASKLQTPFGGGSGDE